ncbi:cutinase 1 [Phaeosphaeriaceae sp. PMI808]|nr:cutinase 1 [Phaeosphaeriaceae sp. PMI808]
MKFIAVSLLASLAAATPISSPEVGIELVPRESVSKTELESGSASACPKAIFIFARGSTEGGNLGSLGVPVADALESKYGAANVWVQGVGGAYTAGLIENLLTRGTSEAAIKEGVRLFNLANTKCPNTPVVSGGYSQGAALAAAAIGDLTATVRNQIVGTVLFGYTKNKQNNGGIPNYTQSKLKVFCASGDLVCTGSLVVTSAHLSYGPQASSEAPAFLISKLGN